MSAAVPSYPPFEDDSWRPSRDFFGGPPPVDMTDPANVPPVQSEHEFLHGEVLPDDDAHTLTIRRPSFLGGTVDRTYDLGPLPDAVVVDGAIVTPPSQAGRYARLAETFSPLIENAVGPGAAAHFESEVRAISHNAIVVLDAVERLDALTGDAPEEEHSEADEILLEFVPDEVKAAYLAAKARVGFWFA